MWIFNEHRVERYRYNKLNKLERFGMFLHRLKKNGKHGIEPMIRDDMVSLTNEREQLGQIQPFTRMSDRIGLSHRNFVLVMDF